MKQLIAGVVIILVIGVGAFLYRNVMERPSNGASTTPPVQTACTLEAKICPDGSSVGRTGPDCAFAACQPPNVEDAELGIGYVVPPGYSADTGALGTDATIHAAYEKAGMAAPADSIVVRSYPIPEGETANEVMIANTTFESSGNPATAMSDFTSVNIKGKTFYRVTVERFEAQVHTLYYLPRANDVLRFGVTEHNVTNWSDSSLDVTTLPGHQALAQLLNSLQSS